MRDENKAKLKFEERQREKEKERLKEKDKKYVSGEQTSGRIHAWQTEGVSGTCESGQTITIGPLVDYGNGMSIVTNGSRRIGGF